MLALTVLTATFAGGTVATHPAAALAASVTRTVTLQSGSQINDYSTQSANVGDFLRERGITVASADYVFPATDVPLSDGLVVTYRAAVPVTIVVDHRRITAVSSAADVAALLAQQSVALGRDDVVHPGLTDPLTTNAVVVVTRVVTWTRNRTQPVAAGTTHRLDLALAPGSSRVVVRGFAGERSITIRFKRTDGGPISRTIVASHLTHPAHGRVVAHGIDQYEALARFAANGIERSTRLAGSAMQMVATAYTAGCAGCSGMTAIGRPAGHGIVAVDPRVIPLGTRLFISGYGIAVAGDTGGSIRGLRIDLGFDSMRDAMLFGRRQVTVYRLK